MAEDRVEVLFTGKMGTALMATGWTISNKGRANKREMMERNFKGPINRANYMAMGKLDGKLEIATKAISKTELHI